MGPQNTPPTPEYTRTSGWPGTTTPVHSSASLTSLGNQTHAGTAPLPSKHTTRPAHSAAITRTHAKPGTHAKRNAKMRYHRAAHEARTTPARARRTEQTALATHPNPTDTHRTNPARARRRDAAPARILSVIIADSQPIMREALARHLDANEHIAVTHQLDCPAKALNAALVTQPDAIVLDVECAEAAPSETARALRATPQSSRLVVFSAFRRDAHLLTAIRAGAAALVSKRDDTQTLADAIHAAADGAQYVSPSLEKRLAARRAADASLVELKPKRDKLTRREFEVLTYIAEGLSKKEIATTMHLAVKTIDNHTTNLMGKLDIHDRVQLARYAIREGITFC